MEVKVSKVKKKNVTMEEAVVIMKDYIARAFQIRKYSEQDENLHDESVVPIAEPGKWKNKPRPDYGKLSKKQKHDLLVKVQNDSVAGTKSHIIMFQSHVYGYYHQLMFNSKRSQLVRAEYARITKRTNSAKQKTFLEFIGLKHNMNKIEYHYYSHRYRRCISLLRQGLYDFETKKFHDPLFSKKETGGVDQEVRDPRINEDDAFNRIARTPFLNK